MFAYKSGPYNRMATVLAGIRPPLAARRLLHVTPVPCREVFTEPPQHRAALGADKSNSMDFAGKHIVVIGGSRGIGAACVEMLARRGADVGFTFISNSEAAQAVEQAVAAEGGNGRAAGFKADVVSQAEMVCILPSSPNISQNTPYAMHMPCKS